MDQKTITLAELEQEVADAQEAHGAAVRRSLDNRNGLSEIWQLREAEQIARDRLAAFKDREREQAATAGKRMLAAKLKKCADIGADALKDARRRDGLAKRLGNEIRAVAKTRAELVDLNKRIMAEVIDAIPPGLPDGERARLIERTRDELLTNFQSLDTLIAATLAEEGLLNELPGVDLLEAVKPLDRRNLEEWTSLRTANVIGQIEDLLEEITQRIAAEKRG